MERTLELLRRRLAQAERDLAEARYYLTVAERQAAQTSE